MFTLYGYSDDAGNDAREIRVKSALATQVMTTGGVDVSDRLIDDGILVDIFAPTPAIVSDLCDAVDSFELFGVPAQFEPCPKFNYQKEVERVGVSMAGLRYERGGRDGVMEYRNYKICRFLSVSDTSGETAAREIATMETLALSLANLRITLDDRIFVVDTIEVEPIDVDQFMKHLIFCGSVDVTLVSGLNA